MKKSKWLDCQGNEFFPKQKGTPSLVKINHKNTATLDSARSKKNLKSQFCNYDAGMLEHAFAQFRVKHCSKSHTCSQTRYRLRYAAPFVCNVSYRKKMLKDRTLFIKD